MPEQESLPPWADLPPAGPAWAPPDDDDDAAPEPPRAPGGRARRGAARRRRRGLITAAVAVVIAGGVAAAVLLPGSAAPAPVIPGALITTFQPGELQTVPNACQSIPAATVTRNLEGQAKVAAPLQIGGTGQSICDWTVDQPPVYRLLQLDLLAYSPSGLASGDGSATNAAIDAYNSDEQALRNPPEDSADPPAAVAALSGLGDEAFSAVQIFRRGGAVTDVATVLVRYHNVTVTVTLNGLDHSNRGSYGPVSAAALSASAQAFAQAAEATLH